MSHLNLPPKPHVTNCVGFECHERHTCLRYLRPAWRASKDKDGKWIVQNWASFDIERKHFGNCQSKLEVRALGAMGNAMARAAARSA